MMLYRRRQTARHAAHLKHQSPQTPRIMRQPAHGERGYGSLPLLCGQRVQASRGSPGCEGGVQV